MLIKNIKFNSCDIKFKLSLIFASFYKGPRTDRPRHLKMGSENCKVLGLVVLSSKPATWMSALKDGRSLITILNYNAVDYSIPD